MKRSVISAISLVLLSSLATAQAQEDQKPAEAAPTPAGKDENKAGATKEKSERIQVTGSRIKQIDVETASPVTTFTKEDIVRSGQSTVSDFIRNKISSGVTMTSENETLSQTSGSVSFGGREVDQQYTLVLVNGRRLPINAVADDLVDLNLVPLAAVERIDYLTDGASAIYGSDAVAGVINIITKKAYNGTSVLAKHGQSSRKDATETSLQIVTGTSGDKANFLISADLFKREPAMMKERDIGKSAIAPNGKDGRSPRGLPGTIGRADGTQEAFADCPADRRQEGYCVYDFAPLYEAIPHSERQSIYSIFDYGLNDDITLFGEARFSRSYVLTANGAAPGGVTLAADAEKNPYQGEEIQVVRRYLDFGPRVSDNTNQSFNLVLGLRGTWNDVNWEFASTKHRLENQQIGISGQIHSPSASKYFNDGTLDPFIYNVFDTPEELAARDAMDVNTFRIGNSTLETYSFGVDGSTPVTLPGGNLAYAAGVEFRKDTFVDNSDLASANDEILGGSGGSGKGEQETRSAYAEADLPVLKEVSAKLAARTDDIDHGKSSATTYNAGLTYRPIEALMFRGTYGTGFKAPGLHYLYLANSFGVNQAIDHYACAQFGQRTSREINSQTGGNPDLKPETSTFLNLGVVAQPAQDLAMTLDYWNLTIKDKIDVLTVQEVLNDEAGYASFIHRIDGRLTKEGSYVLTNYQNLAKRQNSGLDFGANYKIDAGPGRVTTNLKLNKLLVVKKQLSAVQPLCDYGKEYPGVDGNLDVDYSTNDFSVGGNVKHHGKLITYEGGKTSGTCNYEAPETKYTVKARNELALNFTYYAPFGTNFGLGIQNVTDEKPAFDPNYINGWPYYDQGRYSNIGRFYYATIGHEFK